MPVGVDYGTVTGEFVSFVGDGMTNPPDGTPDEVPLQGYVIFTPTVQTMRWPTLVPPKTAVIATVRCPVIEGVLYAPGTSPDNLGDQGVALVASKQPTALPDLVQYIVSFELEGAKTQPPSFRIEVPTNGSVDLSTVIPSGPASGAVTIVSTEDRERAEAAATAAAADAATASAKATAAASSATAAKASETEAEAARDTTLAAAILELRGTGFPGSTTETNTAPVGTYYTDTAGTAGAWRWLKTSAGSGVARWKVVYGDTGWRVVPGVAEALDPTTPGRFFLRREGRVVTLRLENVMLAAGSGNAKILAIPTGFQPDGIIRNIYQVTRQNAIGSDAINTLAVWSYWLSWLEVPGKPRPTAGAAGGISGEVSWTAWESWPTTLPA